MTAVAIYSVVALGLGLLMGRVGLVSLGQIAVLALGAWVAAQTRLRDVDPVPARAADRGPDHAGARHAGRPAGAAPQRARILALITLMLAGAITVVLPDHELPQRRPGLPRPHRVVVRQPGGAPAGHRQQRRGLLPLRGDRGRADVRAGRCWHVRSQAGPGLGGDPPERAGRPGRRREHHALQAVGAGRSRRS